MTINLLPGPVAVSSRVRERLAAPSLSHRSAAYRTLLAGVKARLQRLSGAASAEILMGTGTLANDLVAGQLSLLGTPGIILANGEFGERLVLHAEGFRLPHVAHRQAWGTALDLAAVEARLDARPDLRWIWVTHCETSTGMVNPLKGLAALCRRRRLLLNLDCISSLGVVPVDLRGVHLATSVSGKGLGSYTGLSMVFHAEGALAAPGKLPRYLDLGGYVAQEGVPFSASSNLLAALDEALTEREGPAPNHRALVHASWLADRLEAEGIPILLGDDVRSPAVFTIPVPQRLSSVEVGDTLESEGILVNYSGTYLARRNWIQVCLMGRHERRDLEAAVESLARLLSPVRAAT